MNLKDKILSLPRPDPLHAKYIIEAELEDIMALVETDRIKMQTDIDYAIGYCQGLGHPCTYLESRYDAHKPSTNDYSLEYCDHCNQMTNHLHGVCQKHKDKS